MVKKRKRFFFLSDLWDRVVGESSLSVGEVEKYNHSTLYQTNPTQAKATSGES